jgi:hypothetical protein
MFVLVTVLIMLAAALLGFVVLVQNGKGGGLQLTLHLKIKLWELEKLLTSWKKPLGVWLSLWLFCV